MRLITIHNKVTAVFKKLFLFCFAKCTHTREIHVCEISSVLLHGASSSILIAGRCYKLFILFGDIWIVLVWGPLEIVLLRLAYIHISVRYVMS